MKDLRCFSVINSSFLMNFWHLSSHLYEWIHDFKTFLFPHYQIMRIAILHKTDINGDKTRAFLSFWFKIMVLLGKVCREVVSYSFCIFVIELFYYQYFDQEQYARLCEWGNSQLKRWRLGSLPMCWNNMGKLTLDI